ncbi:Locomotion-related protein Hikaru genki, partial [Pseudolycoriella hygida]
YECKYGFTLVGEGSRRCGADRKWSGQLPTCKEINCGHPGVLYNGWLENIEAGTGLGASLIYRCHPGMLLVGNTSTVCQIDGRWRYSVPECLAPCIVPTISQGTVIPMEVEMDPNVTTTFVPPTLGTATNKVRHGTTLEVICEEFYEFPINSFSPPTCNNGTWSVIPRCIPARCKGLPKPPKFGMVLAPKTEHGMKARFKCKDGFNLTGPGGKEVTDPNEYVLTCSFGNWTGETPMCQEVYCSFPGYIEHGKILLVGNMGLYDYRPYVKKIINNKQIMYDCDKGYVLDVGPPGATCVGGLWRPTELPLCLLGQHPRLRWNRKRRSIEMRFIRSRYIRQNYRELQRRYHELIDSDEVNERRKRNSQAIDTFPSQYHNFPHPTHRNDIHRRVSRSLNNFIHRHLRSPFEGGEAYAKYMETIKQKYQKYVKNILGYNNVQNYSSEMSNRPYDSRQTLPRVHSTQAHNNLSKVDRINSATIGSTPPTLSGYDSKLYTKDKVNHNYPFADDFEEVFKDNQPNQYRIVNNNFVSSDRIRDDIDYSLRPNMTELIAKLKSQIIRRKRSVSDRNNRKVRKRANSNHTTSIDGGEVDENLEGLKRGKAKGPCEPIPSEPFMRVDIIREGRDPTHEYSAGTMVKVTCAKEYKLNLQNPNGTAKCVRSRWKPMKPLCTLLPCSVPSTEHGSYFTVTTDTSTPNAKPTPKLLNAFDEILNGDIIDVQCDEGYNVQGPNQLKCWQGTWDTTNMPECLPAPCILPSISNAIYQGGYRGGLTIAHGSSVSVQCENPANNLPVQMVCALGSLSPKTIQCGTGARRSREEYLSEVEFVNTREDINALINGFSSNSKAVENSVQRVVNLETGRDCGTPRRVDDALVYRNGEPLGDMDDGFQSGTEITFNCIASSAGERTTWKIICEDGQWVGRSLNCANGTCIFRNNEPNVVSFYNDLEIREDVVEFPPGAIIVSSDEKVDLMSLPFIKSLNVKIISVRMVLVGISLTLLIGSVYVKMYLNSETCALELPQELSKIFRSPENCDFCQNVSKVDRIAKITPDEFERRYAYTGRPVIITDATTNWTALETFDFWYFKDIYDQARMRTNKPMNCQFFPYKTGFKTFYEAMSIPRERVNYESGTDPWYFGWSNCNDDVAQILRQHYGRPYFLPKTSENNAIDWIFMGGSGLGAHMHVDNVRLPSWQAQIKGEKEWTLAPPPECYYQCSFITAIVSTGDINIGKYALTGSSTRQCIHSEWNGQKPACFGLNQENDYAMEKAPTILFRHSNGPIAQSNDGKLIVYPGTTVHMECLWMRRFGNPKWVVSQEYRVYPEGWVTDDARDATLEYRLSIIHAVEDDSGTFTCQTPARHEHKIDIIVKAVNCPEIPARRGLTMSTNETKMSIRVQLSCANGNSLIGASELMCLPSGNWSAPLPVCESVECGDLPITASSNRSVPRVAVLSREVGGRAAFSCRSGYGIRGPSESICLPSGEWSLPFPDCVEVQCENPGAPNNGYAQGSAPYRAGDVVQFNCNPEYMMQGQPIIACQDSGRWSGVQACSYPGTAIAGRMSSVKFYYTIGETITFVCDAGLQLRGAQMLKCSKNGKWSNAIPTSDQKIINEEKLCQSCCEILPHLFIFIQSLYLTKC